LARLDSTRLNTFDFVEPVEPVEQDEPCCSNMVDDNVCEQLVQVALDSAAISSRKSNALTNYATEFDRLIDDVHNKYNNNNSVLVLVCPPLPLLSCQKNSIGSQWNGVHSSNCHLSTYSNETTLCRPLAAPQTYEVFAFFRMHLVTASTTPQPQFRFTSLPRFCPAKNLEQLTTLCSWLQVTQLLLDVTSRLTLSPCFYRPPQLTRKCDLILTRRRRYLNSSLSYLISTPPPQQYSVQECSRMSTYKVRLKTGMYSGNYLPLPQGCVHSHSPKTFDTLQHRPLLEVLRVFTRTLIVSVLFSGTGGYCKRLKYYSSVY